MTRRELEARMTVEEYTEILEIRAIEKEEWDKAHPKKKGRK